MERSRYDRVVYRNLLAEMVVKGDTYESLSMLCKILDKTKLVLFYHF